MADFVSPYWPIKKANFWKNFCQKLCVFFRKFFFEIYNFWINRNLKILANFNKKLFWQLWLSQRASGPRGLKWRSARRILTSKRLEVLALFLLTLCSKPKNKPLLTAFFDCALWRSSPNLKCYKIIKVKIWFSFIFMFPIPWWLFWKNIYTVQVSKKKCDNLGTFT